MDMSTHKNVFPLFFYILHLSKLKANYHTQGTQWGENDSCLMVSLNLVGGITHICFKQWFQITADAHPGVSEVSKDQKFCEKFKNTHCQVNHPAKIE